MSVGWNGAIGQVPERKLLAPLTPAGPDLYLARALSEARTAPSSNGKTTDSDSVNRGSNPRGASSFTAGPAAASVSGD